MKHYTKPYAKFHTVVTREIVTTSVNVNNSISTDEQLAPSRGSDWNDYHGN